MKLSKYQIERMLEQKLREQYYNELQNRLDRMGFGNDGYVTSIRQKDCKHEWISTPDPMSYMPKMVCKYCRKAHTGV